MKKLLFLSILTLLPMLASAQTVSDVENSGCLSKTRGEESQIVPTIVLTKEGSTLSVQLLNYEENCGTTDFIVTPKVSTNEGEPCFVTVNVDPVIPQGYWCICPFNVSFTLRDLTPNSFYLDCWWYEGMVELTDGVPLVLEYNDEAPAAQDDYRPFVEEGKVWKVGSTAALSDSIVKMVEYYYFDGDTIIDGKTCKQMMCQRFVSPNHPNYADIMRYPLSWYVGAWYEEDKKVYRYNAANKQFWMAYDFSLNANDTLQFDPYSYISYVIGPKQTGGLEGFKGVYREIMWLVKGGPNYYCITWLEGVGSIEAPTVNIHYGKEGIVYYLMSCVVGDEVIYLDDEFEDGATPAGARKNRFDFTHTIKIQPKTRKRSDGIMESPYGEYNDQQLGINLDPLDDDYLVRITDETDEVVYEKAVNAGNIVGLSIDISAYAKGRYTVTIENSQEAFTGEFETQTTGIVEIRKDKEAVRTAIYNLQGQRLTSPQKGLNIVNGQKIYVK